MKRIDWQTNWKRALGTALIFVIMVAMIAFLYPKKGMSFQYKYEQGKPWMYNLIMAETDFPILKSAQTIAEEKQTLMSTFAPFFQQDATVYTTQLKAIMAEASDQLDAEEVHYLQQQLKHIYDAGVLSPVDMEQIQEQQYTRITTIDSHHRAVVRDLVECFTPKSAYTTLLGESPKGEMTHLNRINLNLMLLPNLAYDSVKTETMLNQLLESISPSYGIVQQGEKIIDRGEIVDARTEQILRSLEQYRISQGIDYQRAIWSLISTIALFCCFLMLMVLYLRVFRPTIFSDLRALLFFMLLMTLVIAMACCVERYTTLSIYLVPFAWVPIIIRVFYDSRTALYMHMVVVLICSFVAPAPFEFIVMQMAAGMVAVSSLKDMAQRSQLVQTALWVFLTYCFCYTMSILSDRGNPDYLHLPMYVYFAANAMLLIFAYGLIFLFEKLFGLVSSITLVELTNINSDLLVEFAEKAPGSFQHSLQVSNLAVEAAKRVGANPLLARTGALYHDIGKMVSPQNYTENQQNGENPLMALSYEKAAQVVISHVANGVTIAQKNHLPEVIIKFIAQHHGDTKTRFFYNSYVNTHPGESINEELFTYPGPRPMTKEVAIVMMADAVEARSRSMRDFTQETIRQMVEQMVSAQVADHQFEQTPLTFRDIYEIKEVFTRKLISMNHSRIAYPELQFEAK
ncbi:MAG: HDIG domain-containing protein [Paludibacteraceae bacterium]|nr:HDIG domain-containing protein [Paludibacteraceae bacterium]